MNAIIQQLSKSSLVTTVSRLASFDCGSCKKKLKKPECNACHKMVNYFNIFAIPQNYDINLSEVTEKAKNLQKEFHPDKNTISDQHLKFVEYSAYINKARSTLLDDIKRAVYLMELKGVNIQDEASLQNQEFMLDMFELQQEIEGASTLEAIKLKNRILGMIAEIKLNLHEFFQSQDLQKCKQFVIKYKYMHRALQNVSNRILACAQSNSSSK